MELKEYLLAIDFEQVKNIARQLNTLPDEKIVNRHWLIPLITDILLSPVKLGKRVLPLVPKETLIELVNYIFTKRPISNLGLQTLERYGIVINGEIPTDIQLLILKKFRHLAVEELIEQKYKTKHTPFLRFIQILNYFKDKDVVHFNFKRCQKPLKRITDELALSISDNRNIVKIIDYLIVEGFVKKEKNKLYFNNEKFNSWKKQDSFHSLRQYYQNNKNSNALFKCLESISLLQELETEWVKIQFLPKVTLDIEMAKNYGLVRTTIIDRCEYAQLTQEGWFLAKQSSPKSWIEKTLLISADFELFIPHTYDPFFLLDITRFCNLKQNEYLLVYDINPTLNKDKDGHINAIEMFFNTIKRKSRFIPNVVEYGFVNILKNPIY